MNIIPVFQTVLSFLSAGTKSGIEVACTILSELQDMDELKSYEFVQRSDNATIKILKYPHNMLTITVKEGDFTTKYEVWYKTNKTRLIIHNKSNRMVNTML